jgi:hypothetical protein
MSSGIVVGFSPNDFFFVKAKEDGIMPTKSTCNSLFANPPQNCQSNPTNDCVNFELCNNENNANTLYNIQNNYGGFDQKYSDGKNMYNDELINTINLGIGIVIATGIICTRYLSK